ncbi:MoaD/ThiS family protein [Corynebacterium uberis]|uniref:MoaD/ThiS family protein n=1 Tax=Corynebacterium TaxID=1716 RepID=UPI001D0ACB21|nr:MULTISPECIES: MoaD/ThiS family protein [Corynebacterium]MCZ9309015.1 MoaD/ThiS family protein [Corynebacterium sp. c6VSa_13]UDL74518.1 MoaD/ThiS family protein [Corynebacterium uberis]UDL76647.1 MoaD/ThiS family protein [Corynebacterium uberis]UDL78860.1 MoaD/ThiS family protein [Corynebacterium uberis]UDL81138.1 MoaD/ThiS family protein [Corynebacterium uberis]
MEIHYFAAAREAAGTASQDYPQPPATLGELLDDLRAQHAGTTQAGMGFAEVLGRCSFLLDGAHATAASPLSGVRRLDVLPPFAGG